MKAVVPEPQSPSARIVVIGQDQPEYTPLPASVDVDGLIVVEYEFTAEELSALMSGGRLRLSTLTFGKPFCPIRPEVVTDKGESV